MRVLLATSNPHKLEEIRSVITDPDLQWVTLSQIGCTVPEPVEDQPTFEANASLKAIYYAKAANMPCVADDSGLEVDALGGEPGVYSARYSGETGSRDQVGLANNLKLLGELGQLPATQRAARFVCAMAYVHPDDVEHPVVVRGTLEGRILSPGEQGYVTPGDPLLPEHPFVGRGENGFGYDPIFLLPELGKTTAEISPDHKNQLSHRGRAARMIWKKMQAMAAKTTTDD